MESALARGLGSVEGVASRATDLAGLWHGVARVLTPLIPNHLGPCCFTLDPASLLMTSHVNPALSYRLPDEMLRGEYETEDVHDMATAARSRAGVSTLHEAAGGDPSRSPRWRANMRMGGDQELLLALRTRAGVTWGCLGLYRAPGEPRFDEREIGFLQAVATPIAEGVRRTLLLGEAREPESPGAPGLLVVTPGLEVEAFTAAGKRWMEELPGARAGVLPAAVVSVAGTVFAAGHGHGGAEVVARVRAGSGTWLVLHGARVAGEGPPRAAIIIEPAHPARIRSLLMTAYGLTDREQEVARLVLAGESTKGIAAALVVSPHTVQEHLKRIFAKTGVRSRRDLVGKVFFTHYEPRLRDNEDRVRDGRPLRGGPAVPAAEAPAP